MTEGSVICAKTLSFFAPLVRSNVDFAHFDPMFAVKADLDRMRFTVDRPLVSVLYRP